MQDLAPKPPSQRQFSKVNIFSCLRSNRFFARYPISHRNDTKVTYLEQLAGTIEQSVQRVPLLLLFTQWPSSCSPPWVDGQDFRHDVAAPQAIGG
jgi:hypothetical protein